MVSIIWSRRLQYLFIAIVTVTVGFSLYQWNASRAALKVNTSQNFNTNGLVGHWTFDGADTPWSSSSAGTTLDTSGNGYTGTLTNMNQATSPVDGKIGQALNFDGVNDHVNLGTPAALGFTGASSEFTIIAWLKPTATARVGIVKRGHASSGGTANQYSFGTYTSNNLEFQISDGVTSQTITSAAGSLPLNVWSFVSCGMSTTTLECFVNGVSVASTARTINASSANTTTIIGSVRTDTGYFTGTIDDVRIYNRMLAPAEISRLSTSGTAKLNVSQDSNLTKGLAGYWKFDEGSGTNANDSSVNGNTGTLVSTPTWTTGQINGGLTFNGANYVSTTQTPLTSTVPNGFSVFVWLQSPNADAWAYDMGGSSALNLMTSATGTYCRIRDTSLGFFSTPRSTINGDGNWHNFGCIFNRAANVLTLYVDGVSSGTVSTSGFTAFDNGGAPFYLGGRSYASGGINGSLDEVRIYDRALSADEANQIYSLTTPTGVDTGLKGHWSFDGADVSGTTASDRSGSGNNGTLTNSPTITEGKLGQALDFNGGVGTSNIDMNSPASLDDMDLQGGGGMSGVAWIYPRSAYIAQPTIMAKSSLPGAGSGHWGFYMQGANNLRFTKGYQTTVLIANAPGLVLNEWQQVAFTWNGSSTASSVQLYINGVAVSHSFDQDGVGTKLSDAANSFVVATSDRTFDGKIDDVRMYNRVLSAGEIQSLYNFGSSDKVNSSASQSQGTGRLDSGLTEYWKFDDGSGTTAVNSSTKGTGSNGTLTGSTLPTWGTGYIGGGLDFNGTTGAYVLGPSNYTGFNDNYTISVWVKSTDATTNDKKLVTTYNGFGSTSELFYFKKIGINQGIFFSSVGGSDNYIRDITDGNWHHLVATRTIGGVETVYADGVQIGQNVTTTGTLTMGFGNTTLRIGGADAGSMNGSLDEVRIYDRALSADEISQLYRLNAPTGVDTSLKGYWSFNGPDLSGTTAYDRSGSGNNGTTSGAVITEGKFGQALSFDGTDDLIQIGSPASLDNITNFSYSAWVNLLGPPENSDARIFAKNIGGFDDTGVSLDYDTGIFHGDILRAFVGFNTTDALATSQSLWSIIGGGSNYKGGWQHVAMTFDGASKVITLYLNGVEVSYQTHTTGVGTRDNDAADNFTIGNNIFGQRTFNGKIDEARVYNRVLSAGEVASLYNSGR
jgi:hypothetical protein